MCYTRVIKTRCLPYRTYDFSLDVAYIPIYGHICRQPDLIYILTVIGIKSGGARPRCGIKVGGLDPNAPGYVQRQRTSGATCDGSDGRNTENYAAGYRDKTLYSLGYPGLLQYYRAEGQHSYTPHTPLSCIPPSSPRPYRSHNS